MIIYEAKETGQHKRTVGVKIGGDRKVCWVGGGQTNFEKGGVGNRMRGVYVKWGGGGCQEPSANCVKRTM